MKPGADGGWPGVMGVPLTRCRRAYERLTRDGGRISTIKPGAVRVGGGLG